MRQYSFEKLEVWQKGRMLVRFIYLISKDFPAEEKFGMTQQIRRAGISITCNLAEGSARITGKEQARFTEMAFGSLMEVLSLLIAAVDLEYITEETLRQCRPPIEELGNKLNALRETQINKQTLPQINKQTPLKSTNKHLPKSTNKHLPKSTLFAPYPRFAFETHGYGVLEVWVG